MNRVENQKLNQTTAELPFGWVFGFQLGLRQTQALINTFCMTVIKHHRLLKHACRRLLPTREVFVEDFYLLEKSSTSMLLEMMMFNDGHAIGINQCLCLPKAELKTKNSTAVVWLSFFVFNLAFGWQNHSLIPIAWPSSSISISRCMLVEDFYKSCRMLVQACFLRGWVSMMVMQ